MNLPNDNHVLIHRYGCSVARRQIQENPLPQSELKDEPLIPMKQEELPTTMNIPSQSQSSPIIPFANSIRQPAISLNILDNHNTFKNNQQFDLNYVIVMVI